MSVRARRPGGSLELQPRLCFDAFQKEPRDGVAFLTVDGYRSLLGWMLELSVASFLAVEIPTVCM